MLGPIEDHRTIGDTLGEILVIAVVSAVVCVGFWIKLAGGADNLIGFDPGAIESSLQAESLEDFTIKTEDTSQP
jgi:hypothetical protein